MKSFYLALSLTLLGLLPQAAMSQASPDMPIVKSANIVEALQSKDIVLDRPGQIAPRQLKPQRDPSISLQVQFGFNSAELTPHGQRQLDELASALANKTLVMEGFELIGHTDQVGDANYNLRLSLDRANAVKNYLQLVHGVASARLQAIGLGFTSLADTAHPTSPINRRVEVRRIMTVIPDAPATSANSSNGHGTLVATPK